MMPLLFDAIMNVQDCVYSKLKQCVRCRFVSPHSHGFAILLAECGVCEPIRDILTMATDGIPRNNQSRTFLLTALAGSPGNPRPCMARQWGIFWNDRNDLRKRIFAGRSRNAYFYINLRNALRIYVTVGISARGQDPYSCEISKCSVKPVLRNDPDKSLGRSGDDNTPRARRG